MNSFKVLYPFLIIIVLSFLLSFHEKGSCYKIAELYITPRNVPSSCFDLTLINFSLIRSSVKVPYQKRNYEVRLQRDSVHEVYFAVVPFPEDLVLTDYEVPRDSVGSTRIMMILRGDTGRDTMYIDREYMLQRRDKYYKASNQLCRWLERQMPADLNDSWVKNLPAVRTRHDW